LSFEEITVAHIASGDRWAGAEVQLHTLLSGLRHMPETRVIAILMNEGELARRLRLEGVLVHVLDEQRHGFTSLLLATLRVLRSERPNIVHTHRQKENLLGSIACGLLGIPSVRTVHGAPEFASQGMLRRVASRVDDWCAEHLQKRVIAVSPGLADSLKSRLPHACIETIVNGINVASVRRSAIAPVDLGGSDATARHIGIVGRLDPVKRVDIFLRMAKTLCERFPDNWRFHVFGEGGLRDRLIEDSALLGIEGNIEFHGHRLDIAACLAALDVLVMCSDHEGMPMTPLEALAVGTPVVAHAVGGLVDILRGDGKGILVSNHDPEAYAEAVASLVHRSASRDIPLRLRPALPIKERFEAEHNALAMQRLYVEVLKSVMT
jgi:glycosyltransferase involved in cell wall biosynthesis